MSCFRSKGSILSQSYRQIQNMIQLYCHKSSKQCKPVQVLQIGKQCIGIYLALAAQICLLGNIPNPSNSSKYILKNSKGLGCFPTSRFAQQVQGIYLCTACQFAKPVQVCIACYFCDSITVSCFESGDKIDLGWILYFESNSTNLLAASFVSSGEPKVEKRKYPSPQAPKPSPGVPTTCISLSR